MATEGTAGVVFYLESSDLGEAAAGFAGKAELTATVTDIDLWESVLHQLKEGLSLHRGKDFKQQMIEMLQEEHEELKETAQRTEESKTAEIERLRQQLDAASSDLWQKDQRISLLELELSRLLQMERELQALGGG
jgi:predicted RNase H-like nuclease (RuvC/YqgF family)